MNLPCQIPSPDKQTCCYLLLCHQIKSIITEDSDDDAYDYLEATEYEHHELHDCHLSDEALQEIFTGGNEALLSAANRIQSHLYLSIGSKVLLTRNVWQQVGLCNGACGIARDIIFKPDAPPPSLAECIIVDFGDGYNGPSFFPLEIEQKSWIPMFPVTSDWSTVSPNGESTRHSMFPLHLCYAWRI